MIGDSEAHWHPSHHAASDSDIRPWQWFDPQALPSAGEAAGITGRMMIITRRASDTASPYAGGRERVKPTRRARRVRRSLALVSLIPAAALSLSVSLAIRDGSPVVRQ
jgi:hypothetical protein